MDEEPMDDRTGDDDRRPALREYALILAVLAIITIVALQLFGGSISDVLSTVSGSV